MPIYSCVSEGAREVVTQGPMREVIRESHSGRLVAWNDSRGDKTLQPTRRVATLRACARVEIECSLAGQAIHIYLYMFDHYISSPLYAMSIAAVLTYLGLPEDYEPSPKNTPIRFLIKHVTQLPPHLLVHFSSITSPKDRAIITSIRNRRLRYTASNPTELCFASASSKWPNLWQGRDRPRGEAIEERAWAEQDFLQGSTKHVGKLGNLLGEYEEEREAERIRILRRERVVHDFVPEEDESSDEGASDVSMEETLEETRELFERRIRERFVYGLLEASCNLERLESSS